MIINEYQQTLNTVYYMVKPKVNYPLASPKSKRILYHSFSFYHWYDLSTTEVRTLEEWCNELAKIPLQHHPGTELGSPRSPVDRRWTPLDPGTILGCIRWLYGYSHDVIGRIIEVG